MTENPEVFINDIPGNHLRVRVFIGGDEVALEWFENRHEAFKWLLALKFIRGYDGYAFYLGYRKTQWDLWLKENGHE